MKNIHQLVRIIFICVFGLVISFPMLYMFGGKETTALYGAENITPLPSLQEKTFIDKQFQKQFENWWQSHFYGRKFVLKLKNQLYDWANLGRIHSGYNYNVIEGKDNYLFELAYFKKCQNISENIQSQKLKDLKNILDKKGIEFYFIIAPNKVETYRDKFPTRFAYFYNQKCRHSDEIEEKFTSMGINVYNAQALMKNIRENENYEPFSVTGTHWNHYGAGRTLQEAAKKFDWGNIKIKNIEKSQKPYTTERDIADLLNLMIPYYPVQYFYKPIYEQQKSWSGQTVLIGNSFSNEFKRALLDSNLVSQNTLYHLGNKPLEKDDIENIKKAKRIIFVYTDVAILNANDQLYKKTDLILSDIQYLFQYDFSKKSNKMEIVGLSHPENWGSWSDGEKVEFVISNLPLRDLQMIFDVRAFLGGKKMVQNVEISANDEIIGHWHFEKGKPTPNTILNIPAEMINSGIVKLTFDFENPLGPKDLGLSEDRRHLGVGFKTMKIIEK